MRTQAAERSAAWGLPSAPPPSVRCKTVAAVALVGPALVFGAAGFALWGPPGLASSVVALLVSFLIVRTATSALLGSLAPVPADDVRLLNLVAGLSTDLGHAPPPTFIVQGDGANALVFRYGGRPALGITAAAATELARIELEAVVAHCLVRSDPTVGGLDRTSLALGGTFGACAGRVTQLDDARAVAVTRYPPALATAIEKATPASGRFSYLWFVAEGPGSVSNEARLEALGSL